jgi:hypothetical protein
MMGSDQHARSPARLALSRGLGVGLIAVNHLPITLEDLDELLSFMEEILGSSLGIDDEGRHHAALPA